MDKERRSRLKRVVTEARKVVEEDVRVQLRRLGFEESGKVRPVEELPHLSSEDRELRDKIVEAVEKEKTGGISDREAFDRYVRHMGFTYVNRVAALRAMEVRGLIKETVVRRDVYGGRSLREYEIAERERVLDPYELLKASLVKAFEEVSAEIKVLFDVNSEYSLIFLGHKALLELIRLLSEEVPKEDWKEDDIIGWIYQYYNEEAKAEFKRAKRKPKADDIPVINQFYTPRWVVRVLVDNTLGRLWLEMNKRCPKLGDPMERAKEQLANPSGDTVDEFCSYLVPLSQEHPRRERKGVREIKVLDPACGSGHFLVYAFDVLYRMYREEEPDTPTEEIPRLILENNLYGTDIDLRALQLAALSLYLKAKSHNPRLKITKMNLVCADARITDGKVRKAFLERFSDDPELQKIFARIFEDLEYTYNVGSLLKVREPFERLLERRRKEGMQAILFPRIAGQTLISKRGKIEGQTELAMSVLEEQERQEAIVISKAATLDQMIQALKELENEAIEKRDMGTLIFASEAEKSVGLLAILSDKYDVVLMNPPYGHMPEEAKEYAKKNYPKTKNDYYTCFIEQTLNLAVPNGFVGMLTPNTFMFLRFHEKLREEILLKRGLPQVLLELGFGVLDYATVPTAATVMRRQAVINETWSSWRIAFLKLTFPTSDEKEPLFIDSLYSLISGTKNDEWYFVPVSEFTKIPGTTFAYTSSQSLRDLFVKYAPLDEDVARAERAKKISDVKKGLSTGDNLRFCRWFWEVNPSDIGKAKRWVPFVNATGFKKYYGDFEEVIDWNVDGGELKKSGRSVIRNPGFHFKDGLTYPITSPTGFSVRYFPKDCIVGSSGEAIFPCYKEHYWSLLALTNSRLVEYILLMRAPGHKWTAGNVSNIPVCNKILSSDLLTKAARESYEIEREWDTGNEISTLFIKPWLLQALHGLDVKAKPNTGHPFAKDFNWSDWGSLKRIRSIAGHKKISIRELAKLAIEQEEVMLKRLEELHGQINEEVYRLYEITKEDKKLIETELALRRGELPCSEEGNKKGKKGRGRILIDAETKTKHHVARLISFFIKKALELDPDGIVPLHELVQRVRKDFANEFGKSQADTKEKEIEKILGKSLEAWIATDYFEFHVNLYKRRPIFWHLTSSNFSRTRAFSGAFDCFLHYHKLDKDAIPKIITNYLRPELDRAKWKVDRLKRELQEARDTNDKRKERRLFEELDSAFSTLEELQNFQKALQEVRTPRKKKTKLPENARWVDQKIAEVRDSGYNPVIEYGVRVNIEPLKEAGLLHKAVRRVK